MYDRIDRKESGLAPIRFTFIDPISDIPYSPRSKQLNTSIPFLTLIFPPSKYYEQLEHIKMNQMRHTLKKRQT